MTRRRRDRARPRRDTAPRHAHRQTERTRTHPEDRADTNPSQARTCMASAAQIHGTGAKPCAPDSQILEQIGTKTAKPSPFANPQSHPTFSKRGATADASAASAAGENRKFTRRTRAKTRRDSARHATETGRDTVTHARQTDTYTAAAQHAQQAAAADKNTNSPTARAWLWVLKGWRGPAWFWVFL